MVEAPWTSLMEMNDENAREGNLLSDEPPGVLLTQSFGSPHFSFPFRKYQRRYDIQIANRLQCLGGL